MGVFTACGGWSALSCTGFQLSRDRPQFVQRSGQQFRFRSNRQIEHALHRLDAADHLALSQPLFDALFQTLFNTLLNTLFDTLFI